MPVGCRKTASRGSADFSSVRASPKTPSVTAYDDPDAYMVYNALLGQNLNGRLVRQRIAVLNRTNSHELCFDPSSERDPRLREAGIDFIRQNSSPRLLQKGKLDPGLEVVFLSSSDLDGLFSDGPFTGWSKFHELHPDIRGYVDVSAIGFSHDRTFAIVYSGNHCGPKCGAGGIKTFLIKHGNWKRANVNQLCSWIS